MTKTRVQQKVRNAVGTENTETKLVSAFYIGNVFHKRFSPKVHAFRYPLYMTFLDLDEVESLEEKHWWFSSHRWAPLQLKYSDYFRNTDDTQKQVSKPLNQPFKQSVIDLAKSLGAATKNINRVCMLAQLRCFGLYFSPVNFFFLYENNDAKYVVAEVSNTPWNNTHSYLVDMQTPTTSDKCFHVSPFMDLNMSYRWKIKEPTQKTSIHIENWSDKKLFTAVFSAKRHEFHNSASAVFLRWPAVTLSIIKGIYWQAAKLFLKGIRYVPYQTQTETTKKTSATDTRSHL